ncbi:MAG: translation initiation factor IF-2 N-terminal domain-containing protein, partial [Actinomycetota bacterium]
MRVHELAKELGMTNQETLGLCGKLGIGVKTQSSTIIEQQADRVRARARRDGLVRDEQPAEPKLVKKAPAKKTASTSTTVRSGTAKKAPPRKAVAKKSPAKKPTSAKPSADSTKTSPPVVVASPALSDASIISSAQPIRSGSPSVSRVE